MSTGQLIDRDTDVTALPGGGEAAAASVTEQGIFGLILLTGLYSALSPWIVGFNATTGLAVNDLIVGIAVAVLALGWSSLLDRARGLTWTLPVAGIWLIISPWVVRDVSPTAGMIWSNVVSGALIAVFALAAISLPPERVAGSR